VIEMEVVHIAIPILLGGKKLCIETGMCTKLKDIIMYVQCMLFDNSEAIGELYNGRRCELGWRASMYEEIRPNKIRERFPCYVVQSIEKKSSLKSNSSTFVHSTYNGSVETTHE